MTTCLRFKAIFIISLAAMFATACTEVNDLMGEEFIRDDQRMSTHIVTLGEDGVGPKLFTTRMAQKDSVPTNDIGILMLGNVYDPLMGYTSASAVVQPVPLFEYKPEKADTTYAGYGAVADSMMLYLSIGSSTGKTIVDQKFTIYELTESVPSYDEDGAAKYYYSDFNATEISDMSRPLFSFIISDSDLDSDGNVSVRLTETGYGRDYMERLLERDWDYVSDSVFVWGDGTREPFRGLYIAPDEPVADAAIYSFTMGSNVCGIALYVHSYDEDEEGERTIIRDHAMPYFFDDFYYYGFVPKYINCLARDYTAGTVNLSEVNFSPGTDALEVTPEVETAYVQGMDGIYTRLTFTEALREALSELAGDHTMAISNATIYLDVADEQDMSVAFTRLGMYTDKARLVSIPDYQPVYESSYGALPYGGYLTREPGHYSMNITTLVQRMVNGKEGFGFPYTISVVPDASATFSAGLTALKGSAADGGDHRIKLKVTYSLIP